ncbi:hypothetical protein MHYP_G00265060 [Metynnis hypsauchen]
MLDISALLKYKNAPENVVKGSAARQRPVSADYSGEVSQKRGSCRAARRGAGQRELRELKLKLTLLRYSPQNKELLAQPRQRLSGSENFSGRSANTPSAASAPPAPRLPAGLQREKNEAALHSKSPQLTDAAAGSRRDAEPLVVICVFCCLSRARGFIYRRHPHTRAVTAYSAQPNPPL